MRRLRHGIASLGLLACAACEPRIDVIARAMDGGARTEDDAAAAEACDHARQTGVTLAGDGNLATLAARTRSHALCACGDYSGADQLTVQGDVAVDGSMQLNADADVAGALTVAGAGGVTLGAGTLDVGGDLAVGGPLLGSEADVAVTGDAAVRGRVQLASFAVDGRLTLPAGAALDLGAGPPPTVRRAEPAVVAACGCDDAVRLDAAPVRALVDGQALDTLDALDGACVAVAVTADALASGMDIEHGGLVVVDGDLRLDGDLAATLPAGETLDVVVTGNVSVDGPLQLGSAKGGEGGEVRLFVLGRGTLELRQGGEIHGLLHAPDAELVLPAPLEVRGSLLVRRVAAAAALSIQ